MARAARDQRVGVRHDRAPSTPVPSVPAAESRAVGADRRRGFGATVHDELAPHVRGEVLLAGDAGYEEASSGYNLVLEHHPAVVVRASGPADVMSAVAFATRHETPVSVLNTGHSTAVSADGSVLINTRRMQGVRIDPHQRVARLEAGATWDRVIHEASAFGLAPLSGSSSSVGAVGYTLGGGLGLLGRGFGYAADHVRSIDIVTAHGTLRQVTPEQYADLFWALRGGKGNFGVITSMEIDLFPVTRLYAGGLYFRGSDAKEVLNAYRRWTRTVPEAMTSSLALIRFPWGAELPDELRGRFVVHVRIAHDGTAEEGERLIRPLRDAAATVLDTVADVPYTSTDGIHSDPVEPFPLLERSSCLRELDEDAVDALLHMVGPDSTCPMRLVELRHLGGALGREPRTPNAVGNRDARFLLYTAGPATAVDVDEVRDHAQATVDRMAPWSTGGVLLNFLGADDVTAQHIRAAYGTEDYRKLLRVKRAYDPENLFRVNHNIVPGVEAEV
ncbi:FAD-binding oxidoreductase [Haloactinomyces albus]|uniref:FAD-binding oxidoreductase n=1 Tax=Haloactinomyces albus TaxID=1352928 RepID=UPI00286AE5F8|nr:FAD-binding oxidoreductase [Haloactinomyces albus]